MKKLWLVLILFVIGCSKQSILSCNYVDYSSIYGTRKVTDKLVFKNDRLVSYNRNIIMTIHENVDIKKVRKSMNLEGKSFKKLVGGKYKVNKSGNSTELILKSNPTSNLSYIGIDIEDNYESMKANYSSLGFSCK